MILQVTLSAGLGTKSRVKRRNRVLLRVQEMLQTHRQKRGRASQRPKVPLSSSRTLQKAKKQLQAMSKKDQHLNKAAIKEKQLPKN